MFRLLLPYQRIVDIAVAVLFVLFVGVPTIFGEFAFFTFGFGSSLGTMRDDISQPMAVLLGWIVVLLLAVALALRRWSPPLSLTLAWASATVQVLAGFAPWWANLAILVVLYSVAAYGSRRVLWWALASAVVGAVIIAGYVNLMYFHYAGTPADLTLTVLYFVSSAFALILAWTGGALVRAVARARAGREEKERAEAEALAEQQRTGIARDMHDVVAHSLAVVIAQADGARYSADADVTARALTEISSTARAALSDVRVLLTQLRHSQADGPQPRLADLDELYSQVRSAGVALSVDSEGTPPLVVPAAVELAAYRILQEALTNALRHGGNSEVRVRWTWQAGQVQLAVTNAIPGDSIRPRADSSSRGHGVIGMRERAQLVGGTLDAGEESDAGTPVFAVRARLPLGGGA